MMYKPIVKTQSLVVSFFVAHCFLLMLF